MARSFYGPGQADLVTYRPHRLRALFILAFGFMWGAVMIPDYLAVRQQHQAGIHVPCVQHPVPAPPMPGRRV